MTREQAIPLLITAFVGIALALGKYLSLKLDLQSAKMQSEIDALRQQHEDNTKRIGSLENGGGEKIVEKKLQSLGMLPSQRSTDPATNVVTQNRRHYDGTPTADDVRIIAAQNAADTQKGQGQ